MFKRLIQHVRIRKTLFVHRIYLRILKRALESYQSKSTSLVRALPKDVVWTSGVDQEERQLDAALRIVNRRLNTSKTMPLRK